MTEYADGTSVRNTDFTGTNFPDTLGADVFGDLDYFDIQPPSSSCTSIRIRDNTDGPYSLVHPHLNENKLRTVVCMGTLI